MQMVTPGEAENEFVVRVPSFRHSLNRAPDHGAGGLSGPSPQLLIAAASALAGQGTSRPRIIESGGEHTRGARCDAAMIHHVGYWSHYDHRQRRSLWPMSAAASLGELAQFAAAHGVLRSQPRDGDILLQFGPLNRDFVRAGVVADVVAQGRLAGVGAYFDVVSLEDGTDEDGNLDGRQMMRVERRLSPERGDRFVRWADLGTNHRPEAEHELPHR